MTTCSKAKKILSRLYKLMSEPLLYMVDVGTDIWVAMEYYETGDMWWFGWTVFFICLSFLFVNGAGVYHVIKKYGNNCRSRVLIGLGFPFLYVIVYGIQVIPICNYRVNQVVVPCSPTCDDEDCGECERCRESVETEYRLAWIRHIETITESAPQLCLQIYIMLRGSNFSLDRIISAVFSLVSIVKSIYTLERFRLKKNKKKIKHEKTVLFVVWQMFAFVSRLSAIVYCAYVFGPYVFLFVLVHWILATACLPFEGKSNLRAVGNFFLVSTSSFFYISEPLLRFSTDRRPIFLKMNFSLAIQNILMLSMSLAFQRYDGAIKRIAKSCILGGLVLWAVFFIWYFRACRRTQIEPIDNRPADAVDAINVATQ